MMGKIDRKHKVKAVGRRKPKRKVRAKHVTSNERKIAGYGGLNDYSVEEEQHDRIHNWLDGVNIIYRY